jgi:predicted PurR-regulated permease PerM
MNMETLKKHLLLLLLLVPSLLQAMDKEIPFTLDDRDRIIRTEQKVESLQTEVNVRLKATDQKIDDLRSEMNARFDQLFDFLWAIISIFTAMMISVFGFAFWDRKLSLAPMKAENRKTLNALREFAEHQPKLREILKNAGLM